MPCKVLLETRRKTHGGDRREAPGVHRRGPKAGPMGLQKKAPVTARGAHSPAPPLCTTQP